MLKDKLKVYSSPTVSSVEFSFEGILCYSNKFDVGLGGWEEDSSGTEGDAN